MKSWDSSLILNPFKHKHKLLTLHEMEDIFLNSFSRYVGTSYDYIIHGQVVDVIYLFSSK